MAEWKLTNGRRANGIAIHDLYCGDNAVLTAVGYDVAMQHVLDSGDDADTYQEDHMAAPETVAQLREQHEEMNSRFNS